MARSTFVRSITFCCLITFLAYGKLLNKLITFFIKVKSSLTRAFPSDEQHSSMLITSVTNLLINSCAAC